MVSQMWGSSNYWGSVLFQGALLFCCCTDLSSSQDRILCGHEQMNSLSACSFFFFFFEFFGVFFFLGPHPRHMEVSGLRVELKLQPPSYTTATATRDLSHVCD